MGAAMTSRLVVAVGSVIPVLSAALLIASPDLDTGFQPKSSRAVPSVPEDLFRIYGMRPLSIEFDLAEHQSVSPVLLLRSRQEDGTYVSSTLHAWAPRINTSGIGTVCRLSVAVFPRKELDNSLRLLVEGKMLDVSTMTEFSRTRVRDLPSSSQIDSGDWVLIAESVSRGWQGFGWLPRQESELQAYVCISLLPGPRLAHPKTGVIGSPGEIPVLESPIGAEPIESDRGHPLEAGSRDKKPPSSPPR